MSSSTINPPASPLKEKRWMFGVVLACVTIAAYVPGMNAAFLWDDAQNIVDNASIRSFGEAVAYAARSRRPVIYLSLWGNYALGGLNVIGYHALNLAVHLVAGLALFGVVSRTLRLPRLAERFGRHADWFAFCAALIWMIHPLQTQAVTYVIQRCESMMGMFYLLCLYCLVRASQSRHSWRWYAPALVAGWLGTGCKEVMITAPLVLLLYDRAFLSDDWKAVLRKRWGFYLGLVPACAWLVMASVSFNTEGDNATAGFACATVTPLEYLCSQPGVMLHYLRLAALPDALCFDHGWPVARGWSAIGIPAAAIAILIAASVVAFRFQPPIGFLGLSFFLILAPTSSIMPIADLAVEHRMYLPLAPLVILTVFGFHWMVSRMLRPEVNRKPLYAMAFVVVAVLLSARTFVRNCVYRSPLTMWSATVVAAPKNARAHQNLGYHLHHQGEIERAIEHYVRGVELDPDQTITHGYLAVALAGTGKRDEAIAHLRDVLEGHPDFGRGHFLLGRMLRDRGETAEALEHFRRSLEIQPNAASAHHALGAELARSGQSDEAFLHLHRACELSPGKVQYRFDLGLAYQRSRAYGKAIACFEQTLRMQSDHLEARRNIETCRAALDGDAAGLTIGDLRSDS